MDGAEKWFHGGGDDGLGVGGGEGGGSRSRGCAGAGAGAGAGAVRESCAVWRGVWRDVARGRARDHAGVRATECERELRDSTARLSHCAHSHA